MILAELEVFHSRPIAPTRRVALGHRVLPVEPAPGFGGILLGAVVAGHIQDLDPDLHPDLHRLTLQLEHGRRIPQPRLRYRYQVDRVGLTRSRLRLIGDGERLEFDFDGHGTPAQYILGAVYAAGQLPPLARARVMAVLRLATRWQGPIDRSLVGYLSGLDAGRPWSPAALGDPVQWALHVLGFTGDDTPPGRPEVQRRFRQLVRDSHPDHGAAHDGAAQRIFELTEARRILLV